MKFTTSLLIAFAVFINFLPIGFIAAQEQIDPLFNPNFLITDEAFTDTGTFGSAEGLQKFLEQRNSPLARTDEPFLSMLKEPSTLIKVGLEDPRPELARLRSAAELIYDAASKHGLNPQVLLVMLEKEQSLITGSFSGDTLQRRLDRALGFGCPDYEGCGDIFLGFYRQLFGTFDETNSRWLGAAASLMKSFKTEVGGVRVGRGPMMDSSGRAYGRPVVKTARKGDSIQLDNTLNGYLGVGLYQTVTLENFATAALYRYTPHVFNGNYNFWKIYNKWFKYPNGTVIKLKDQNDLFVIDNGTKRMFSELVAKQRKIKIDNVVIVSQTELDSYITDIPMPPLEKTLIKGDNKPDVFMILDTKKRPISEKVFKQKKLSFANVITVPQTEVDGYAQGAFILPNEGTLVTSESDPTVYIIADGLKRPISYEVFKARKLSFKNLMVLADDEIVAIPKGLFLLPPDKTALKVKDQSLIYWFRDNQKRSVSEYVYKQRGVVYFPEIQLGQEELDQIPTGTPLPPKDGTIIKGDSSSGIYKIENGLKRLLTAAAYKRLRYPKAVVLPQSEVDGYAEGEIVVK